MRIYLVGFMGVGKSYLGRQLADLLGFQFADLDELVEQQAGASVARIFAAQGEAAFRQMEADCLRETASLQHAIIATGGGAPCFHGNMEWMNEHGITLHLQAPASLIAGRLRAGRTERPLLAGLSDAELAEFVEAKLAERSAFYQKSSLAFDVPANGTDGLDHLADYLRRFFPK